MEHLPGGPSPDCPPSLVVEIGRQHRVYHSRPAPVHGPPCRIGARWRLPRGAAHLAGTAFARVAPQQAPGAPCQPFTRRAAALGAGEHCQAAREDSRAGSNGERIGQGMQGAPGADHAAYSPALAGGARPPLAPSRRGVGVRKSQPVEIPAGVPKRALRPRWVPSREWPW